MGRNGHNEGLEGVSIAAEAALQPLVAVDAAYKGFDLAEQVLSQRLGVPLCVANCGRCCAVTTIAAWDVEVEFLIAWLLGQGAKKREEVLSICEGWLLERDSRLKTYGLAGTLSQEQYSALWPEVAALLTGSPCPMLTSDKRCRIHAARPLVCRAYGTTRMPAPICPRPLARSESVDTRSFISPTHRSGQLLKAMVQEVMRASGRVGWMRCRFLPTALMMRLAPVKYNAYVTDGRVVSAKLAQWTYNLSVLFQDELDAAWAQGAILDTRSLGGSPKELATN